VPLWAPWEERRSATVRWLASTAESRESGLVVGRVDVCAGVDEGGDNGGVAAHGSIEDRRLAKHVRPIDVRAALDEVDDDLVAPFVAATPSAVAPLDVPQTPRQLRALMSRPGAGGHR